MKDFALFLEKIAQVGVVSAPSPAQLYAAQKAEREYEGLLSADSPKAYATAITGGIMSGLGIPVMLSLGNLTAGSGLEKKIEHLHGQAYLKEALTGLYGFEDKEARQVASAMISQNPNVTAATNDALQLARLKLAKQLSDGPLPGVPEEVRGRIVERAKIMIDDLAPEMIFSETDNQQRNLAKLQQFSGLDQSSKIENFPKIKNWSRMMSSSGHYPTSLGFPGFSGDEINALLGIGTEMYIRRTGKPLDSTRTAIKLVSKHIGNSLKAGLPIAAITAGVAVKRQMDKAKILRAASPETAAFEEF